MTDSEEHATATAGTGAASRTVTVIAEAALHLPSADMLTADDRETLRHLARKGTPVNTLRAYAKDLAYLEAWCRSVGVSTQDGGLPWPASVELVRKFIAHHLFDPLERARNPRHGMPAEIEEVLISGGAKQGRGPHSPATVRRRLGCWATLHRSRGLASPTAHPAVRDDLRRAARAAARPRRRKSQQAIAGEELRRLLASCDERTLVGLRDKALLTFAFASGGRRRSEVAALTVERLRPVADGYLVELGRTKTTDEEDAATVALMGSAAQAMATWLARARLRTGPVFRAIDRWGTLGEAGLSGIGVAWIVKARLKAAGLDPALFSAHGLRAGFLTEAGRRGIHLQDAMRQSLHKSIRVASGYYDPGAAGRNPATTILDEPR